MINVRSERFKFNGIRQEPGEQLSEFVVRLREAGAKCEFGSFIELKGGNHQAKLRRLANEEALLDRFVMGLHNKQIQEKLLIDNPMSFEAAYSQAKTMQMALDEKQSIKGEINVLHAHSRYQQNSTQSNTSGRSRRPARQVSPVPVTYRQRRAISPSSVDSSDRESGQGRESADRCNRCGYRQHYYGSKQQMVQHMQQEGTFLKML